MKQHEFCQITLKLKVQWESGIRACMSSALFAGDKVADSDITETHSRRQRPKAKLWTNIKMFVHETNFPLKQMHYCH
jgi:hypothetical protein